MYRIYQTLRLDAVPGRIGGDNGTRMGGELASQSGAVFWTKGKYRKIKPHISPQDDKKSGAMTVFHIDR